MPSADDVEFTPPADCCFDALTVQDAISQLIMKDKMVAVKMVGTVVIGVCDLVEWESSGIHYMKKAIQ